MLESLFNKVAVYYKDTSTVVGNGITWGKSSVELKNVFIVTKSLNPLKNKIKTIKKKLKNFFKANLIALGSFKRSNSYFL